MATISARAMVNKVRVSIAHGDYMAVIEMSPDDARAHAVDVLAAVIYAQQPPCPTLAKMMEGL